jgi:hypothetical protein
MNIDQRLEVLTQSLELVAAMQGETEKRVARLEEAMIRAEQSRTLFDERHDKDQSHSRQIRKPSR